MRARLHQPGTAAHDDAVSQRNDRFGKLAHRHMRHIFGAEAHRDGIMVLCHSQPVEIADITSGTEGAWLGASHHDMTYSGIFRPGTKLFTQRDSHVEAEGVQRLRTVEQNKPRLPFDRKTDIVLLHCVLPRCWLYVPKSGDVVTPDKWSEDE